MGRPAPGHNRTAALPAQPIASAFSVAEGTVEKLLERADKVVAHGRYITFQMAEVAVPRDLFRDILRRIDRLRRPVLATT